MTSKPLPFARRIQNRPHRAQGRISARFPATFRAGSAVCGAEGRNVSENGLLLQTPRSAAVGERVVVTCRFPASPAPLSFAAEVCWVDADGSLDAYVVGCRILHTPRSRTLLRRLLWNVALDSGRAA